MHAIKPHQRMVDVSAHFSGFGWPLENLIGHDDYVSGEKFSDQNSDSIDLQCSPAGQDHMTGEFSEFRKLGDTTKIFKKLNHNASERDRRKKMNTMYSTLRALLPPEDQSRKLSIPATISRVLKYIPELQKEVGTLIQKKEHLISKKSKRVFQEDSTIDFRKQISRKPIRSSSSTLSATRISEQEIVLQFSMAKFEKGSISDALWCLEKEGFLVLSTSCFQSFGGRVFYNAHIQGQGSQNMDVLMLKEKVWAFYDKGEEIRLNCN
ncbi:transcription factor ORG2-like isoform X2 [Primulina huaijiensis]|uniref:transcription factor ORG2-like isoform X2 n=1 Tax=Primulina huaijiensis TaxID=1492673 RepID=UPI003CC767FA